MSEQISRSWSVSWRKARRRRSRSEPETTLGTLTSRTARVMRGVRTASPSATAWTASMSSRERTSLSRNPEAPASSPPKA